MTEPTHGPSEADWECHKATIRRLFLVDELSHKELLQQLADLGLRATKAQLKYRLKKWNLRRNLPSEAWQYINHQIAKHKRDGKESDVVLSGVRLKRAKVVRETNRNRSVSIFDKLRSPSSPRLPDGLPVTLCSPGAAPMQVPCPPCLPWLKFLSGFHIHISTAFAHVPTTHNGLNGSQNVSKLALTTLYRGRQDLATINSRHVSHTAAAISQIMPESYDGENGSRVEVLLSGPSHKVLQEALKVLILELSNNLQNDDYCWSLVTAIFKNSNLLNLPFPVSISETKDATLSSFAENLFRLCLEKLNSSLVSCHVHREMAGKLIPWLLDAGYNPNLALRLDGLCWYPIQYVARWGGRLRDVAALLLRYGADLERQTDNYPFHALELMFGIDCPEAGISRDYFSESWEMIDLFLSKGANVGVKARHMLHRAITWGDIKLTETLQQLGADIGYSITQSAGMVFANTAIVAAVATSTRKNGNSPTVDPMSMITYVLTSLDQTYGTTNGNTSPSKFQTP